MNKNLQFLLSPLVICAIVYWIFRSAMPHGLPEDKFPLNEFSTKRALEHVARISKAPHYAGSANHDTVAAYLINELKHLGLKTTIQEGYAFSNKGSLVKARNILARLKGTGSGKALMLLSHYDCAVHSHGAADAGSGVATILEGLRAFMASKPVYKNDIIILFTDGEELGLNGADLFVSRHPWIKDTGLVLNFEARGTSGPSYMLMETNGGNAAMIKGFKAAGPDYPVANSLMYSIYKMLPNDTDLTVFRENGNIQGFNFAFIDDHFNYHTQQDDLKHLSPGTLTHQGTYLMPLLSYFSNAELDDLKSDTDHVYFNTPLWFFSYPFSWNIGLMIIAFIALIILVVMGLKKEALTVKDMLRGLWPFFAVLILSSLGIFLVWQGLLMINPQYKDILHGFTYNGHAYIGFTVFFTLALCFFFYADEYPQNKLLSYFVVPVFILLLVISALMIGVPGSGFFIIPVFCSLIVLGFYISTGKVSWILNLILAIPALVIFTPFITALPVGLGLGLLAGSSVLTVMIFTLMLPEFGSYRYKRYWIVLMAVIAVAFLIHGQIHSGYSNGKAKPNSLLYILDADAGTAVWTTYDKNLDSWTKTFLKSSERAINQLRADHPQLTYVYSAPVKEIPEPTITLLRDSLAKDIRHLKYSIVPTRKVNSYLVTTNENMILHTFTANGINKIGQPGSASEKSRVVLSYYVINNEPLEMEFSINRDTPIEMSVYESSFDLLNHPLFNIPKRESWMMPTIYPLDGAVIIKKNIRGGPRIKIEDMVPAD